MNHTIKHQRSPKWVAIALATLFVLPVQGLAAPKFERGARQSDLLTDGLDGLLGELPGIEETAPGESAEPPAQEGRPSTEPPSQDLPRWLPDTNSLDKLLEQGMQGDATPNFDPRSMGEDVGRPQGQSPLTGIHAAMQQAKQLVQQQESLPQAQATQEQIVADLQRLIDQLEKQQSQSSKSKDQKKKKQQKSQRTAAKKPGKQSKQGQKPAAGKQAARESTVRLGSADAADGQPSPDELMKQAWGSLPERVREQMLQSASDEFLPKYREEIERYFERLAEENETEGSSP